MKTLAILIIDLFASSPGLTLLALGCTHFFATFLAIAPTAVMAFLYLHNKNNNGSK